ncbi:MAG: coproporphyrinogen III oxidase [Acidobacteria bacterium]|nr:MAG: coproporphyrinogen III oxidase [Acidobacteriota bacterium]
MKRLGIYVQVPFCQTKCTYCNFHTGVVSRKRFAPYAEAVCEEINHHRQWLNAAGVGGPGRLGRSSAAPLQTNEQTAQAGAEGFVVDTVYFGGGTPSLLEAEELARILEAIREAFGAGRTGSDKVDGGFSTPRTQSAQGGGNFEEVTLEADPETVEEKKAMAWVRAGINRVSFGVQSFSDKELAASGRMHRRADIYRAVPILRAAGIRNISFDLIAGLPHQTKESWKQSVEELIALGPEHVSVYLLEVDEGSRLGKELLAAGTRYSAGAVPGEDEMAEFYETAQKELSEAGYRHYEISNWAKPGFESKHNLKYWRREPYLGFGAGAHSFSGKQRWANAHDAAAYVSAIECGRLPVEQLETVTTEQALNEELFLGLRQLAGIDVGRIERAYGVTLAGRFEPLAAAGLVKRQGDVVRLAEEKLSVSNEVFVELMK